MIQFNFTKDTKTQTLDDVKNGEFFVFIDCDNKPISNLLCRRHNQLISLNKAYTLDVYPVSTFHPETGVKIVKEKDINITVEIPV